MKRIKMLVVIGLLACAPIVFSGMTCKPSEQRLAYNSLYSVEVSTTATYDAYITSIVKGQVTTNDLPKVSKAYNDFQIGLKTAVLVMRGNVKAPASPAVIDLAAKVTDAVAKAR